MADTCAETIRRITRDHLLNHDGVALGQCLSAVGWVGGTVPELTDDGGDASTGDAGVGKSGLLELSMSDVAGGGIAVGLALAGRRPIYIVRYQGFQWYNAPMVVNYAAKSKELWGVPCPVFVRSIAMDGGIGPVASGSHHGIFYRMPGIPMCAPMTPGEYQRAWDHFSSHDDPLYVSEHRRSFSIAEEMTDVLEDDADITLLAISSTRLNARAALPMLAAAGIRANLVNLFWLKPLQVDERALVALRSSKAGLVLDGDHEDGVAKCLAFDLMHLSGKPVHALGLAPRTAGFAPALDNLPPSAESIVRKVRDILSR